MSTVRPPIDLSPDDRAALTMMLRHSFPDAEIDEAMLEAVALAGFLDESSGVRLDWDRYRGPLETHAAALELSRGHGSSLRLRTRASEQQQQQHGPRRHGPGEPAPRAAAHDRHAGRRRRGRRPFARHRRRGRAQVRGQDRRRDHPRRPDHAGAPPRRALRRGIGVPRLHDPGERPAQLLRARGRAGDRPAEGAGGGGAPGADRALDAEAEGDQGGAGGDESSPPYMCIHAVFEETTRPDTTWPTQLLLQAAKIVARRLLDGVKRDEA